MARILEYQQDKLASSVVGVPSQDRSGEILGAAAEKLGNTGIAIATDAIRQRRDILATASAADLISKYETGAYDTFMAGVDSPEYQQNPSAMAAAFQEKSKELTSSLGLDKQPPEVQRLFNAKKLDLDVTYHKKVREWQRNQENFNATTQLQATGTRTANAVYDAAKRGRLNDAVDLMKGLDMTAASSMSVLGPAEAAKLDRNIRRETLEALYAGVNESEPLMASKLLDHEGLGFKKYFTPEEIAQKRELAKQAVLKWDETQKVNTLMTELDDNRALAKSISEGNTPWQMMAKYPNTPFKEWAVKQMVATENQNMTDSQKAFEKQRLTTIFKGIQKNKAQTLPTLQNLTKFQTDVMRLASMKVLTAAEADKWIGKATAAISTAKRERSVLGKVAGLNGLKDTEALMAGWEQIETWSKANQGQLTPDAEFQVFTNLISDLDPTRDYKDADIQALVNQGIRTYLNQSKIGTNISTYSNAVLRKGGGYTALRLGPSTQPIEGAPVVKTTRISGTVDGKRAWQDPATGKLYDSAIGGTEIK